VGTKDGRSMECRIVLTSVIAVLKLSHVIVVNQIVKDILVVTVNQVKEPWILNLVGSRTVHELAYRFTNK
jgi:hypothetical protein